MVSSTHSTFPTPSSCGSGVSTLPMPPIPQRGTFRSSNRPTWSTGLRSATPCPTFLRGPSQAGPGRRRCSRWAGPSCCTTSPWWRAHTTKSAFRWRRQPVRWGRSLTIRPGHSFVSRPSTGRSTHPRSSTRRARPTWSGSRTVGQVTPPRSGPGSSLRPAPALPRRRPRRCSPPTSSGKPGSSKRPTSFFPPVGTFSFYSGNNWNSANYAVGVATCRGPEGPCSNMTAQPILSSGPGMAGPGGESVFFATSGTPWMAFHAWVPGAVGYPNSRALYLRPLNLSGTEPVVEAAA